MNNKINKIKRILKEIEKSHKVKVLFAVENGSRAWRLQSKDSDYDVRFVFVRYVADYITINAKPDVIQRTEGEIDFVGFDVIKFTKMLSSSNPAVIEWLDSDIVYYGKQNRIFQNFARYHHNKISLYYHYKSMCRENYLKYLKSHGNVTYKKYLYAMRGLVNAKWIENHKDLPPINFISTLKKQKFLPKNISDKLIEIVSLKREGKEEDIIQNIVQIDDYIEEFLKEEPKINKKKYLVTNHELDKEMKKVILGKKRD